MTKAGLIKFLKQVKAKQLAKSPTYEPMLATKVAKPFDSENWIYEVKWDGYRIIADKQKNQVRLLSRQGQNYTAIYNSISKTLLSLPYNVVLDGEIVMLDENGLPSFDLLQQVKTLGQDRLLYCVFDILWIEGYSLLNVPLMQRKKILDMVLNKKMANVAHYGYTENLGTALFEQMKAIGMERIVAKEKSSLYQPGMRTENWQKIQTKKRQEFVIGGWTESESGRPIRSLIFGYYNEKGLLTYFGHSGGGFTEKQAAELKRNSRRLQ